MKERPDPGSAAGILRVLRTKNQAKLFYNRISRVYDLLADRNEAPIRNAALDLLQAAPGEQVLEIGFGTGHVLRALAGAVGPSGQVLGIDLSDRMVKRSQQELSAAGLLERCELRCCDASVLPYAAESLDAVFMSFTLELFDTPEIPQVLRECRRVLKSGGRLVVAGVSREEPGNLWLRIFEWTHVHFPTFVDCRPIYVRRALEATGFQINNSLKKRMWIPVEIVLGSKS
jgi:ubiquinone/menaquinone biosynthesis C-methylase UbiE